MKFNRERFIDETTGDLGAAFDCIDSLIEMLNALYGKANEERQLLKMSQSKPVGEYLDPTMD